MDQRTQQQQQNTATGLSTRMHRRLRLRHGVAVGVITIAMSAAFPLAAYASTGSDFGAGYLSEPAGFASASATFTVPTVSCTSSQTGEEAIGVMLQGSDDATVYQQDDANALLECNAGTASYQLHVDAGSASFTEPGVSPGDTVVASIFQTSTVVEARVDDRTSGYTWDAAGSPLSGTGWTWGVWTGAYYWGGGFVAFTSSTFTKCQINGDYLTYSSPIQYNYKIGRQTAIRTGALNNTGDGFKLTWT